MLLKLFAPDGFFGSAVLVLSIFCGLIIKPRCPFSQGSNSLSEMLRRRTDCGRSGDFFSKKAFVAALSVRTGMGRLHGKALASAAAVCAVELFRPLISELVPPAIW
jgi:hypothetical protein